MNWTKVETFPNFHFFIASNWSFCRKVPLAKGKYTTLRVEVLRFGIMEKICHYPKTEATT